MEFEQILELINTVSAAGLSSFTLESEGMKIAMEQIVEMEIVQNRQSLFFLTYNIANGNISISNIVEVERWNILF